MGKFRSWVRTGQGKHADEAGLCGGPIAEITGGERLSVRSSELLISGTRGEGRTYARDRYTLPALGHPRTGSPKCSRSLPPCLTLLSMSVTVAVVKNTNTTIPWIPRCPQVPNWMLTSHR